MTQSTGGLATLRPKAPGWVVRVAREGRSPPRALRQRPDLPACRGPVWWLHNDGERRSRSTRRTIAAPGPLSEPALELEGLERRFGERAALCDVSVRLEAGRTLAVFGANGAGKTTLLRVLAGLLRPHAGEARVLGAPLPDEVWRVRGRIGYLGHDPLLYRDLSGRENLLYQARLFGVPRERVREALAAVGLERRGDEPVRDLSKGMVQRLAAARATLHDPDLLLLDEPRAHLDPTAAERLEPLIGRPSGRARVLVTHDVPGGLGEADLTLGLRGGRQVFMLPAGGLDPARAQELYTS